MNQRLFKIDPNNLIASSIRFYNNRKATKLSERKHYHLTEHVQYQILHYPFENSPLKMITMETSN